MSRKVQKYRARVGVAWPGLIMLLLAGCLAPAAAPPVPGDQQQAFDAAVRRSAVDPKAAAAAFEAFIARHPGSPLADDAAIRRAELAFAAGREDEGLRWLGSVLTQYPSSDGEPRARLRLAEHEWARDRRVAARGLLDPVDLRRLPETDARRALELRVSLAQTPVERMQSLSALRDRLSAATGGGLRRMRDDRADSGALTTRIAAIDEEMKELVARAAIPELEAMRDQLGRRTSPATADLISAELERRSLALAGSATADRASGSAPAPAALTSELAPLRELSQYTRPDTRGATGTLGVVLPLSGDFAEFGEASLRGILLATGAFERGDVVEGDGPDVRLKVGSKSRSRAGTVRVVVRDSGGDPQRAAQAVAELSEQSDVLAVVGPIFSDEAVAAADAAERAEIPLVTLSNREDVTRDRRFVMRTRTTPADEVAVLVEHAKQAFGATRYGVLYPKTRYGRGMRKVFADAVAANGGKLVALASYAPDETDFSNVIREMVGYRFLTAGERGAIAERDRAIEAARKLAPAQAARARKEAFARSGPNGEALPPIVDFDVLFIPDAPDAVAMIAPGLALQGVQDIRLLGSSDWLDESLLRGADRHLAGAVISAPFFAASDVGIVRDFVGAYRATFDGEPDDYAAQGYDAANLVLQQLASRRQDRRGVRDGILAVRAFPGASGSLTMSPDGNARRRPFLVGVSGQRFVPLD